MFAATDQFVHEITGGTIVGYAVPSGGIDPCGVELCAGDVMLHLARAGRFSRAALKKGLRAGWCGFEIPGAGTAFALASNVHLRCRASGRVLAKLAATSLLADHARGSERIGVKTFIKRVRGETDAGDLSQILGFAREHYRLHGRHALVDAAYRMLLQRAPDPSAIQFWNSSLRGSDIAADLLWSLVQSDEFSRDTRHHIPGPFHPSFRFDRSFLNH